MKTTLTPMSNGRNTNSSSSPHITASFVTFLSPSGFSMRNDFMGGSSRQTAVARMTHLGDL